jgi:hypothetical protein
MATVVAGGFVPHAAHSEVEKKGRRWCGAARAREERARVLVDLLVYKGGEEGQVACIQGWRTIMW